ncbi:MAG: nucleotidyltransferase substrate binding protein [Cyclobacteriaceae bacterium]|jgi:nucleotidyltransferase substrate binding protein (TIGR01987 family)|uniref:Nucleotidyltransferase substrate binding protein n=2 Tax=Algoriphagus marincola TaxID=264027 RepID=A0ABS7N9Q5_9BACT|nr:nucleotidyltransferase substrate binding protein [Algoriphagus marincola]MBY5952701.1 nucleotidyltransferase substrate binding protein [Algoriphagus marincola]MCR9081899.1 nucleotidyltransferase substrate binding protein [Cyclobacteriaceae bacterium]
MKSMPPSCEDCFHEFKIALEDLQIFVKQARLRELSESRKRELIANFEVAHELALKVIKSYLKRCGKGPFTGSRDLTVEAFHADLIDDGKAWLDMVIDRIQYNPIYELDKQPEFFENIVKKYTRLLDRFEDTMDKILA